MNKPGFLYSDGGKRRRIYFIEGRGKDISFPRWRATLYYHPNFAATAFFGSAETYEKFISAHKPQCFDDFREFAEKVKPRTRKSVNSKDGIKETP